MRLNEQTIIKINDVLEEKKRQNPIRPHVLSVLGIELFVLDSSTNKVTVCANEKYMFDIEDLGRAIEELQMLKESIEEVTGVIV